MQKRSPRKQDSFFFVAYYQPNHDFKITNSSKGDQSGSVNNILGLFAKHKKFKCLLKRATGLKQNRKCRKIEQV